MRSETPAAAASWRTLVRDRPLASKCPASRSVTTCLCAARTVMGRVVAEAGSGRQLDGVQGAVVNGEHPVGFRQEGGAVGDDDPGDRQAGD